MDTAEEWAKRLGTTVMTEEECLQLRDRRVRPDIRGMSIRVIDDMSSVEIYEYVAERAGIGQGLMGVLPPYTGPDDLVAEDSQLRRNGDTRPVRAHRQKMRLVFVEPDPHPELDDPDAVTFTPDAAIARAKEQRAFGMSRAVGPITDIKAALMTAQEAHELLEHGTPPAQPGAYAWSSSWMSDCDAPITNATRRQSLCGGPANYAGVPLGGSVCENQWPVVPASNEESSQLKRNALGEPLSRVGTPPGGDTLAFSTQVPPKAR